MIDLFLNYSDSVYVVDTVSDFYVWNGQVITSSGVYTDFFINENGCDSVVFLDITIVTETGFDQVVATRKELLRIIDVLGKETSFRKNMFLFYVYDDGSIERYFFVD